MLVMTASNADKFSCHIKRIKNIYKNCSNHNCSTIFYIHLQCVPNCRKYGMNHHFCLFISCTTLSSTQTDMHWFAQVCITHLFHWSEPLYPNSVMGLKWFMCDYAAGVVREGYFDTSRNPL